MHGFISLFAPTQLASFKINIKKRPAKIVCEIRKVNVQTVHCVHRAGLVKNQNPAVLNVPNATRAKQELDPRVLAKHVLPVSIVQAMILRPLVNSAHWVGRPNQAVPNVSRVKPGRLVRWLVKRVKIATLANTVQAKQSMVLLLPTQPPVLIAPLVSVKVILAKQRVLNVARVNSMTLLVLNPAHYVPFPPTLVEREETVLALIAQLDGLLKTGVLNVKRVVRVHLERGANFAPLVTQDMAVIVMRQHAECAN